MEEWICEEARIGPNKNVNYSLGILCDKLIDHQGDVFVYNSEAFGKLMLIDNIIQITEKDYENCVNVFLQLANLSKENNKDTKKVLVIGGGDGSVVNGLIQHGYKNIDWVEINPNVKEMAEKHFDFYPKNTEGAILNEYVEDGFDFIQNCQETYDIVLVDIEEDVSKNRIYSNEFYKNCSNKTKSNGVFVINILPAHIYPDHYKSNYSLIRKNFDFLSGGTRVVTTPVPSYCFGLMSFIVASSQYINDSFFITNNIWRDNYKISNRKDVFEWNCRNFFPWNKVFDNETAEAINFCIDIGHEPCQQGFLSNFSFSHRVYGSKPIEHRIAFGTFHFAEKFTPFVNRIAHKKNINLHNAFNGKVSTINGVGLDPFNSEIRFYALYNKNRLDEVFPDLAKINFEFKEILKRQLGFGIVSVSFVNNIVAERKIYYVSDICTAMVTNKRGAVLQYNPNNQRESWYYKINEKGKKIVDSYWNNFKIPLNTINFSSYHNYTLYFENK